MEKVSVNVWVARESQGACDVICHMTAGYFSQFTPHKSFVKDKCFFLITTDEHRSRLPVSLTAVRGQVTKTRTTILSIDDDRSTAGLIVEELSQRGFEVIVAYDGHEGFVSILRNVPDLVLCDIGLPRMSGFEILERVRELSPRAGHIPFILLTALSSRESELRARHLGADDYITKPIDFDILEVIINTRLAAVRRAESATNIASLNDREVETLTLAARGKTSIEIAKSLGISKRTVNFHLDNARGKLGAASRTEAAIKAVAIRLIDP